MRKIERNMVDAIKRGHDWRDGNTAVEFRPGQALGIGRVTLHGNTIAILFPAELPSASAPAIIGACAVRPVPETFRRWPTVTTASRLRALGIQASAGPRCGATIDGVPV